MLLGLRSQGLISDFEAARKLPGTQVLAACESIFGVPIAELFPGLHERARKDIRQRARLLAARPTRPAARKKRDRLAALLTRLDNNNTA